MYYHAKDIKLFNHGKDIGVEPGADLEDEEVLEYNANEDYETDEPEMLDEPTPLPDRMGDPPELQMLLPQVVAFPDVTQQSGNALTPPADDIPPVTFYPADDEFPVTKVISRKKRKRRRRDSSNKRSKPNDAPSQATKSD